MSTLGLFNTSNWAPNQLERSFESLILTRYPGTPAMLTALSARFEKPSITSHRHHWFGNSMVFARGVLTGALQAGTSGQQAQINVDDSTMFVPGAVVRVNVTGELMLVVSIVGPQSLIVRRQFGITPAAAAPAGTAIWQVGSAYEEGSLRPLAKSFSHEEFDNITQIFRNSWAVTGTVVAENPMTGEKIPVTNKKQAAMFHAVDREMAMLFGERHSSVHNGQPIRTMDGLISQIKQHAAGNVHWAGSTTTFKQLGAMVDGVFDVSTDMTSDNDRLMLVGNKAYSVVNELGKINGGQVNITNKETKFGMQFSEFSTDVGNFKVVKHPLFNINPEWSSMALIIDPSSIKMPTLRKTVHNAFNSSLNSDMEGDEGGMDAQGGTFLTEHTLACMVPEANAVIYGLCQAACAPCVTPATVHEACLSISHPCSAGAVAGGQTIFLSIQGSKPSTVHSITTPTGVVSVTTNAQGNATVNYVMPTNPGSYGFFLNGIDAMCDVQWSGVAQVACVADCVQVKVESNSCEPQPCDGIVNATPMEMPNCPTDVVTGVGSTQS